MGSTRKTSTGPDKHPAGRGAPWLGAPALQLRACFLLACLAFTIGCNGGVEGARPGGPRDGPGKDSDRRISGPAERPPLQVAGGRLHVMTAIAPLRFLAEKVGGGDAEVHCLLRPGQSPHAFEPSPRQMTEVSRSELYLSIGLSFEKSLAAKISSLGTGLEVVDVSTGIRRRHMDGGPGLHGHGTRMRPAASREGGDGGTDPHVWLDPLNAVRIVKSIEAAFSRARPALSRRFASRASALIDELQALHGRLSSLLAPLRGRPFYVFHPAFGYLADRYGLVQVPVEYEGKEPSPKRLAAIVRKALDDGVKVIFVQKRFPKRAASKLAEAVGARLVVLDPLEYDYLSGMRRMADTIAAVTGGERSAR